MTQLSDKILQLENDLRIFASRFFLHLENYEKLVEKFEARGKNHDENARRMNEMAERHNQIEYRYNQLDDKMDKLSGSMDNLAKTMDANRVRDTTIRWFVKTIIQAAVSGVAITGGILAIIKYFN